MCSYKLVLVNEGEDKVIRNGSSLAVVHDSAWRQCNTVLESSLHKKIT